MDCGADGQVLTSVSTPSQPSGGHQKTFHLITNRWHTIWPEFRNAVTDLMESYKQERPDWSDIRILYLELPDEPLAEDAEWSIGVVFSRADTMWTLPYHGWTAAPDRARAFW